MHHLSLTLTLFLLTLLPLLALCAEDYYKLLNLPKTASSSQIKKAYRTQSKKFHPDKNPDDPTAHATFVEIAEAYDILSDTELRKIYDTQGHAGVKAHQERSQRGGGAGHDPFDLFSRFFGGGGHFHTGQRRGQNMELRIAVALKDFYTGAVREFKIEKQVICQKCSGSGSEDGQRDTCAKCRGQGMVVQKHMLAPGIFQQVQMQCDACSGRGSTVKHVCKICRGERVVREEENYDLHIEPGMPRGVRITYENEADESPDWVAGDVVVHLHEKDPEIASEIKERTDGAFFRRKGDDLFWREVLSLREAWIGGWMRNLTHLDGHVVRLSRPVGVVVQPGTVEVVEGEGMPVWSQDGGGQGFGKLVVEYTVVLPDQLEKGIRGEFEGVWDKWRKKNGVDLLKDSGRPLASTHDEL